MVYIVFINGGHNGGHNCGSTRQEYSEAEHMSYLHHPGTVGEGHDVPLFPEES